MALRSLKLLACPIAFALAVLPASAQNDPALAAKLEQSIAGFHGKASLYAKDLATGQTVTIDADQPVPTASVIKLTVLYTALEQIREGRVHFDDKLILTHQDQVPGSGVLLFLDTPLTLTLKDALTLMIAVSDNTGTNLVIDHLGLKTIDDTITAPPPTGLGLHNTWLYKKVYRPAEGPMPADQPTFGLGKTTAREMASVMERFVTCSLGPRPAGSTGQVPSDKDLCDAAMHMLKVQQDREMIPRYLEAIDTSEKDSAIADKIGTLDHVRNDVGAVYTKHGTIIISAFTHDNADTSWTPDNQAELLIAKMAKTIVDTWDPGSDHPAPK
ncbi:MAG: serine hydrolase [Acidobacteriaceae bacterium]